MNPSCPLIEVVICPFLFPCHRPSYRPLCRYLTLTTSNTGKVQIKLNEADFSNRKISSSMLQFSLPLSIFLFYFLFYYLFHVLGVSQFYLFNLSLHLPILIVLKLTTRMFDGELTLYNHTFR